MRGFIAGAFDLLHPGHLHILLEASLKCNYLVVGLHVDPNFERRDKSRRPNSRYLSRQRL